ncbi:ABC transporter substrate-binding protein [Pseudalkalibacillus hwajinpoensis]|uniref:Ethanolamine utilization protein EutJ n=1 Tax=Guptibacillus hwajinpoensis TaxID=208199 RepID=A0A4U1MIU8_9BACL|nr:ABC transporter substrate-binding protein [Pseudalkalibacillus hwajinpoensis]TKD71299.1 ethanolamine utilization protein EutJ [Pseudalkalibacillus hwajinpoensis]
MKFGKTLFVLLMVLVAIMVMAGCAASSVSNSNSESSSNAKQTKDTKTDGKTSSSAENTVNIGFSGPLSGPAAYYGENTLSGLEMAVDEINEEGFEVDGKTYDINLVTLDDQYLPNETGTNARRLVQENNTPVIFVPHSGGVFATQVFNEKENFLIAAYTSEPKIMEQNNSLTLGIPPAYSAYPEPFTKYEMERFGKKIALLPTASQYGKDWTDALKPVWEENGGEVVFEGSIDFSKDTDFFSIVTKALSNDPDVLFVGGPSQPTALVIKQARELGFEGGFMVMDQAKIEEMEPVLGGLEQLEGAIGTLPIIESDASGAEEFIKKYKERFDRIPTAEGAFNYQAMHVLVNAMKESGSVDDPTKIMASIEDGIKTLPDENVVWHINGLVNGGAFDWKPAIGVVEDGKVLNKDY